MARGIPGSDASFRNVGVKGCFCGRDHVSIVARPLVKRRTIDGIQATHWGLCPDHGDPIFFDLPLTREDASPRPASMGAGGAPPPGGPA